VNIDRLSRRAVPFGQAVRHLLEPLLVTS